MEEDRINKKFIEVVDLLLSRKIVKTESDIWKLLNINKARLFDLRNQRAGVDVDLYVILCENFSVNRKWMLTGAGEIIDLPKEKYCKICKTPEIVRNSKLLLNVSLCADCANKVIKYVLDHKSEKISSEEVVLFYALQKQFSDIIPAEKIEHGYEHIYIDKKTGEKKSIIVDIAIPDYGVFIEVDGMHHSFKEGQVRSDLWRLYYAFHENILTLHIPNGVLVDAKIEEVLKALRDIIQQQKIKEKEKNRVIFSFQNT